MNKPASDYFFFVFILYAIFFSFSSQARASNWELKSVSSIENNPGLRHYVWKSKRAPYGQWDTITLHRIVYKGSDPHRRPDRKRVIFIIPGTWSKVNPTHTDESVATNLFLANRGFDVYSMDFRTAHMRDLGYDQFGSHSLEAELNATADWTYGLFREDIKACIEKAKKLSRANKIFLAGRSRGGAQAYYYASKYWKEDLKGLIDLDGGGPLAGTPDPDAQMTAAQYRETVAAFKAGQLMPPFDKLLLQISGNYEQFQLAGAVPESTSIVGAERLPTASELPYGPPPDGSEIATLTDYIAYDLYWRWGEGKAGNFYGLYPGGNGEAYIDKRVAVNIMANNTRYWPAIQELESSQIKAYAGPVPFMDYVDNLADVTIPVLHFGSEFLCSNGVCTAPGPYKVGGDDITVVYLKGYGHLDVYAGTHSLEDVKKPLLKWLLERQ